MLLKLLVKKHECTNDFIRAFVAKKDCVVAGTPHNDGLGYYFNDVVFRIEDDTFIIPVACCSGFTGNGIAIFS